MKAGSKLLGEKKEICTTKDENGNKTVTVLHTCRIGKDYYQIKQVKEESVEEVPKIDKSKTSVTDAVHKKKGDKGAPALTKSKKEGSKSCSEERVTRTIRKEFKLPGMIGGDSPTALTFSSLKFEIAKGRKQGYEDSEICSAIISKVADREFKEYFENEPDIELDDVLEMLKCVCKQQKSSATFTTFTNDKQRVNEKPHAFIARVLRLRKKVLTLAEEEGRTYPEEMLAERSFEVIFGGLRDENIRSGLRDKLRDNTSLTDMQILKHVSDVVDAETERKLKLFGKGEEEYVEVSEVVEDIKTKDEKNDKKEKKKLNPFNEIDELRNDMKKRDDHVDAQLNEIKQLIKVKNGNEQQTEDEKPKKKPRKCPKCIADNRFRCRHCWDCGSDDHKRGDPNCSENQ